MYNSHASLELQEIMGNLNRTKYESQLSLIYYRSSLKNSIHDITKILHNSVIYSDGYYDCLNLIVDIEEEVEKVTEVIEDFNS